MLKTALKVLRIVVYGILLLLGVTFAVSNKARVDLSFFPFPYALSVPMFMVAIVLFTAGALTAWLIVRFATLKERLQHRKTTQRMLALENEIAALRSEQLVQQHNGKPPLSLVK